MSFLNDINSGIFNRYWEYKRRQLKNMSTYKMIALDLDETVLTRNKEISTENRKWIHRAYNEGVIVAIATGRGYKAVKDIYESLGLDIPMVLANGAEIWGKSGQILKRLYIEKSDIRMLHDLAKNANLTFWGYSDNQHVPAKKWTEESFALNFFKFAMRSDDPQMIHHLRKKLQDYETIKVTWSNTDLVEISRKGVSKETGIKILCDHLGINLSEVMAIGDNMNDIELIQAAGLGVAMGNAQPEVKAVADETTDTNENDGVAKAIQKHVLVPES